MIYKNIYITIYIYIYIPNSVFGLTMSPQEFVVCVHLWLGISLFPPPPSSSRCICGSILDCHGDHVLGCHSGSTRIKRHDAPCAISYFTVYKPTIQEPVGNNVAAVTINQGQVTFSTLTSLGVSPPISISLLEILYSILSL